MPTLKEISAKSGYSLTTISRVLNGDPAIRVKDATRKAILDAAEDLQYKPSRHPQLNSIQELTWHIVNNFSRKEELTDPYYLSVRHGIENALERLGIPCKYRYSDAQSPIDWKSDVVLMLGFTSRSSLLKIPLNFSKTIFIDSTILGFDSVVSKLSHSVYLLFDHLYRLGHRDILFLGARDEPEQIDEREQAYVKIAAEHQVTSRNRILTSKQFSIEAAYDSMKNYLAKTKRLPTAIIAASDSLAIGAMHALHEMGIQIPEEISVTGINGIPMGQFTQPSLTTIELPAEAMGEYAVHMLLEKACTNREHAVEVLFPVQLLMRKSTAKARR